MAEESKTTVLTAMAANFGIAVAKLAAGLITGSAALLAEAGHSVADTMNQIFLLVGLNLSGNHADESHPHGYGKEAFFWSFLVAIFLFVAGAAFAFYEGGRTLIQNDTHERSTIELVIGFGVLGLAFIFESVSFAVAVRGLRHGARERGWTIRRYIRQSPDLTTKTVFWEDSAALIGLTLAALGLLLSELNGTELWDGLASVGIGLVLTAAALVLGAQARSLLLGAAASQDTRDAIRATLHEFEEVNSVVRLLTMQIGVESVLVTGELDVRRGLTTGQIEDLIIRLDKRLEAAVPEVSDTFWELRHTPPEPRSPRPAAETSITAEE